MSIIPCGGSNCPVLRVTPKYPFRVRMLRQKGFKLPPNTKRIDRTTKAGNPYKLEGCDCNKVKGIHGHTREESVQLYRMYAAVKLKHDPGWLEPWRGKNVACFCKIDEACHGDVVLDLANSPPSRTATAMSK
ncbi:MAG: DUF4326 domain-containing protein [Nitrososphaerota archaeon]|nr:DUF4326 domain-containing protein [Nitrososphaerota archaeon]